MTTYQNQSQNVLSDLWSQQILGPIPTDFCWDVQCGYKTQGNSILNLQAGFLFIIEFWFLCLRDLSLGSATSTLYPPPPLFSALRADRYGFMDGMEETPLSGWVQLEECSTWDQRLAVGWHLVWILCPLAVKWSWQAMSFAVLPKVVCSTWA